MIYLSELLRSKEYDKAASPLTLALGKDIAGRPTVADLARMPHLLVAGTTGSGKSVAINAMITSMLYHSTPEDVRAAIARIRKKTQLPLAVGVGTTTALALRSRCRTVGAL